jgi:hypothetical protein
MDINDLFKSNAETIEVASASDAMAPKVIIPKELPYQGDVFGGGMSRDSKGQPASNPAGLRGGSTGGTQDGNYRAFNPLRLG